MKQELNDQDLEQVVGGTVYVNTSKMRVSFTTLGEGAKLRNCEDYEVMALTSQLYGQYKSQGNLAYETAVKEAFKEKGWIN